MTCHFDAITSVLVVPSFSASVFVSVSMSRFEFPVVLIRPRNQLYADGGTNRLRETVTVSFRSCSPGCGVAIEAWNLVEERKYPGVVGLYCHLLVLRENEHFVVSMRGYNMLMLSCCLSHGPVATAIMTIV